MCDKLDALHKYGDGHETLRSFVQAVSTHATFAKVVHLAEWLQIEVRYGPKE